MHWCFRRLFCLLFCIVLSAFAHGQNIVTAEDISNGKIDLLGKSGRPLGTLLKGKILSRAYKKDLNSVVYTVATVGARGEELKLTFVNDLLFEKSFVQRMPTRYSEAELVGKEISFFEDVTFGGDPIGFNTPPDIISGPSFKCTFRINIVPTVGDQALQYEVSQCRRVIGAGELGSGEVSIYGLLGVPLGTVKTATVRIDSRNSKMIATLKFDEKELSISEDDFAINVSGTHYRPADLEVNSLAEVTVYERLLCSWSPAEMKATERSDSLRKFSIKSFFVIKVDESSLKTSLFDR